MTTLIGGGDVLGVHQLVWRGFMFTKPMDEKTTEGYFAVCTIAKLLQKEKWRACSL